MSFGREAREPVPAVGTVCFKGEDVLLTVKASKDAAMIVHELAANARF